MANVSTNKKNLKYINKDFAENRTALINFAKNYFPNVIQDFNESSPSTVLLELCAYLGDILSFYTDVQLMESMTNLAEERINLYNLAQNYGYKPKTVVPASVDLDVFQLIPAIGNGNSTQPDFRYALYVEPAMVISTAESEKTYFYTKDAIDFRFSSSYDPTVVTTYSVLPDGQIEYYLLKKRVRAVSGELKSKTFSFSDPKIYDKIVIDETNVTEIVSVVDSDSDSWYEVPYLAQDLIQIPLRNVQYNDPVLSQYQSSTPYLLTYKQTEKRFVTRLRKDDTFEMQFGSGLSSEADEEIVPNPFNVGLGLNYFERVQDVSIDPFNFLYTKTYGSVPNNTLLTVQYATANGIKDNVSSNTINRIVSSQIVDPLDTTDQTVLQTIKDSLSVNNPSPAFGGQNRKPMDVIRQEAMANFAAQNRAVTKEDYILRCFTMPSKFGGICKAYIEQDSQLTKWNQERVPNPFALNLYVLSYDANKNFVTCNEAIKQNLRQYLRQYRLMTDAINIKDPFIVNIGLNVEIFVRPNENSNEVLLRCVNKLIEYFDNDKMGINSPIFISDIRTKIDMIEGVQSVASIEIVNLIDRNQGYSGNVYDIKTATRQDIVYPPITPSIFSVQYGRRDIKVRAVEM